MTEAARLEGIIALVGAAAAVGGLKQVATEADRAQRGLDGVEKQSRTTSKGVDDMGKRLHATGQKMQEVGGNLTRRVSLPLAGLGILAAKVGADFEAQMSKVDAKSGATAQEFERLRAQALQLGRDTSFSAREAAEGMEILAAAGLKPREVMAAMPGLLDAAAASGESLADTSNVVANALAQFNLDAGESTRIADVLAKASNETQGSIGSMGEALKYAGTGAAQMGLDIEQTTALISKMVKAGIDGGQAGTALRMGLLKLATVPPMKALDKVEAISPALAKVWASAKPVPQKLMEMSREFEKLDGQSRAAASGIIFGSEASTGMLEAMKGGPEAIQQWTASMRDAEGEAKRMGAAMRDNLRGDIEALGGSIETAFIGLFDQASGPLREVTQELTGLVNAFSNADPVVQQLAIGFGAVAFAVGPLLMIVGSVATGIGALAGAAALVTAPMVAIGVGVVAAGVALVALYRHSATARAAVSGLWEVVKASPIAHMVRWLDAGAQKLGGWGDVFRYAGIAVLGFARITLQNMLVIVRAVDGMAGNWLEKFSTILSALAYLKPEFKGAARAVEEMASRSSSGTSAMERAMTSDLKAIDRQIASLKQQIAGIPATKSVTISVREQWNGGRGPRPSGPTVTAAEGGRIEGPGTGTSDSIPALLSNGEHVVTAREVKAMGGHDAVERWRAAALKGTVQMYAKGGSVKKKLAPADANRDGRVTPREQAEYAAQRISTAAMLTNAQNEAALARAENTASTTDDVLRLQAQVKAALAQERRWQSFIGSVSYRRLDASGKASAQQSLAAARRDVRNARDRIAAINAANRQDAAGDGAVGGVDGGGQDAAAQAQAAQVQADLAAQLEQQRRVAANAQANYALGQAEIRALTSSGDIGFGGGRNAYQSARGAQPVNVIVQSLTGYSPEIREVVADAAGGGFAQGGNASRMYTGRG